MEDYLDEIETLGSKPKKYATLALVFSCITYAIGAYIAYEINGKINNLNPYVLVSVFFCSILLGFAFTVASFIKKEPGSVRKWIAAVLNTFMFLAFFSILAYEIIFGF